MCSPRALLLCDQRGVIDVWAKHKQPPTCMHGVLVGPHIKHIKHTGHFTSVKTHQAFFAPMSPPSADVAGPGYRWSQTKSELTLCIALADGVTARDIACDVSAKGSVSISRRAPGGSDRPVLVAGELFDTIAGSVWSVERGILTVEIEKARPRFWPCAIRGHPEVDVAALQAQEKAEQEPFYKPPPDAEAQPRRVNDRETLLKLKAEFPQLAASLPVEDPHTTTHRNHAGPRKTFDWGALPTDIDEEGGPGGSSGSNSNSSTSGVGSKGGTTAVPPSASGAGAVPELPKTMDEASREILRLRAQVATLEQEKAELRSRALAAEAALGSRSSHGVSQEGAPSAQAPATGGRREGSDYSWGTLPDVTELAPATRGNAARDAGGLVAASTSTPKAEPRDGRGEPHVRDEVAPANDDSGAAAAGAPKYVWGKLPS